MRLLSTVVLIACVLTSRAQQAGIIVQRNNGKSVVEFRDARGQVLKVLDVKAMNPYKMGASPRANVTSGHTFSEGLVSDGNRAGVAIAYRLVVYSEEHEQLQDQGESTLKVYNTSGQEVFRKTIDADNAHDPLLSPNGKYVAVVLNGLVYDAPTRRTGFIIYDVASKSVVFEEKNLKGIQGGAASHDLFVFTAAMGGADQSTMYYVFDTRTAVMYKRAYPLSVARYIKRIDNEGAVFLLPPDGERVETYREHFTVVKP